MQDRRNRQRSLGVAMVALLVAGVVTACTNPAAQQMPPVSKAADSPVPAKDPGSLATGAPFALPPTEPHYIVVEQGQSLNRIAHSHHVTPAALAVANQLQPPYKLKVGLRLVLPRSGPPPIQQANASSAAPPAPALPVPTPPASPGKNLTTAATAPPPVPPTASSPDGPTKESAAPPTPQLQTQAASVLPRAPSVLPPRNPAAALPLPGEPAMWPSGGPIVNTTGEGPTN